MPDDNGFFDYMIFEKTSGSGGGGGNSGGGSGNNPGCLRWIVLAVVAYIVIKLFGG